MIQLRYCFLADAANFSGDEGQVNALGIRNHLVVEELPGRVPPFYLVFCLSGKEEDAEKPFLLEGGLLSPSGVPYLQFERSLNATADVSGELPKQVCVAAAESLALREVGLHVLRLRVVVK